MTDLPPELSALAEKLNAEFSLSDPALTDENLNTILGLAGVAAHKVVRPAAPVTTYVLGYLAGQLAAESEGTATEVELGPIAAQLKDLIAAQGDAE
ncbi:DUF6457 domain-containing protein [Haematomicrobium sanguinis]|uniref:DUF6457 domain-containing protein n=1 Tax=Haematomicrobium sanguinis TaxID=479106 RepID=UPI000690EDB8|nr:DUF6457 domain-containing protein [Haematomicrobium sanguinis]